MPFLKDSAYWTDEDDFFRQYRNVYEQSLQQGEEQNLGTFDALFFTRSDGNNRRLSRDANRAALFIMLFRDYPLLNTPYQFINSLLEIDELLAQWRYRCINMVQRMIGSRIGTGGSTGAHYLKNAADSHYIFNEFADLTSFLIQRSHLPVLPEALGHVLGYTRK